MWGKVWEGCSVFTNLEVLPIVSSWVLWSLHDTGTIHWPLVINPTSNLLPSLESGREIESSTPLLMVGSLGNQPSFLGVFQKSPHAMTGRCGGKRLAMNNIPFPCYGSQGFQGLRTRDQIWQKMFPLPFSFRKSQGVWVLWARNCGWRLKVYENYSLIIWMIKCIFLISHNITPANPKYYHFNIWSMLKILMSYFTFFIFILSLQNLDCAFYLQ